MSSVTPQGLAGSPQQPARFVGWAFLSRACPLGPTIHPPDLPAESSKHHTGRHYEPAHVCSAGTAQANISLARSPVACHNTMLFSLLWGACSQLAGNPLARRPVQVWLFVNHERGIQVSNQGSLAFLFFTPHAWCTRDLCLHCVCAFSLPCSLECSWWRKGSLLGLVVLPPSVLHLWGRSRGKWRPCPPVQGTFLCPACTPSTAPLWQK